ncbi:hypothetical protein BDF14DRAFT_1848124 [Spinellus fusiger]|nr:hypothetical protein BDF14DRAFT_1848124 [Spinellus fusiger]
MQDSGLPDTYPTTDVPTTPGLRAHAMRQSPQQYQHHYPVLGVKMSRPCNVVSFSKTHPQLLATGLDKVRNDPCLLVWDVSQAMDNYCGTPTGAQTPTISSTRHRPSDVRSSITSWKPEFVNSRLVEPMIQEGLMDRSKYIQSVTMDQSLPILGSSYREQKPIQHYGSSEAIASCAWSTHSNSPLLVAGMGGKYMRIYDIRVDSGANPLQFTTKAVYGTLVDPFNPYRLASHTEEGVVKVWDIRNPTDAVLTLHPENGVKNFISRMQFSPTRQGFLAILSKDANNVQVCDLQETSSLQSVMFSKTQTHAASTSLDLNYTTSTAPLRSTRPTATIAPQSLQNLVALNDDTLSVPVLWKTRKTSPGTRSLASFAFIPSPEHISTPRAFQKMLAMNKEGQFETIYWQEALKMAWQPTGGMAIAKESGLVYCNTSPLSGVNEATKKLSKLKINTFGDLSSEEMHAQAGLGNTYSLSEELSQDVSVAMRKRVGLGYSMNCAMNREIIKSDRKLQALWTWMDRAEQMSKGSAQIGNIDYSFQGVYGIWMGPGAQGRKASPSSTPHLGHALLNTRPTFSPKGLKNNTSIEEEKQEVPIEAKDELGIAPTARLAQRKLALAVCGFGFTANEFENQLVQLEANGEYDKAAGWALFNGFHERAISALGSSRGDARDNGRQEQQRKLMSAVFAGYQPNATQMNPIWQELCESLSADMVDRPYLRAIFAYIASNDWSRVLDEPELPLSERMAVALRVLDDDKMQAYLNKTVEQLVQSGDVEGVVVTGLTSRGVDLLEQALDYYGDVQTASLVMSFVVPRRFKDKRVEDWVESYRTLLDRWQLWHPRAKFDIERGKYMNSSDIAPPQVYVRCTFCAQSLGHSLLIQNVRNREGKRMNVQTNVSPASGGRISGKQKSTVCPSCRKLLPRCALCLLHMGTPIDPLRQAIAANNSHNVDPAGFDLWFTWCQTCRHGGHALHIDTWFQKHNVCPVSNCTCQCQFEP